MFDISLIGCQIDRQSQQLYSSNIRMREEYQFYYIVHTVSICQSIADTSFSRQQVQNI